MDVRKLGLGLLSLAVWLAAGAVAADTATLTAARDNTLYEVVPPAPAAPDRAVEGFSYLSNGAGEYLFAGRTLNPSASRRRGLLYFDIAGAIPAGATIHSVQLTLTMSQTISGPQDLALHAVAADWGEGTSNATFGGGGAGAPATTDDATWFHTFFSSSLWTTPGGDFSPVASATAAVDGDGPYTWGSTPQLVANAQGWLDQPATNFGWLLLGNEAAAGSAKRFDTRENADVGSRPVLLVDFTPALGVTAVPMLSLWGLALLALALAGAAGWALRRRARV